MQENSGINDEGSCS